MPPGLVNFVPAVARLFCLPFLNCIAPNEVAVDLCRILLLLHLFIMSSMDQAQPRRWRSRSFALLWRYRNHFPEATFAQYVTNPLPQSEAQTALTGMFPLAIYRKKGAAGA